MWIVTAGILRLQLFDLHCNLFHVSLFKTDTHWEITFSCTVTPHCVPCCHPQINTQNGGLQQQQAIHGDILSELQSHHPFLLQPAKEVCFCGPPTTQKSDPSLSSITNTNRHRCYWPSWRPASTAPFTL